MKTVLMSLNGSEIWGLQTVGGGIADGGGGGKNEDEKTLDVKPQGTITKLRLRIKGRIRVRASH